MRRQMSRSKALRQWMPWYRHIRRIARLAPDANVSTSGFRRAWNRVAKWDVRGLPERIRREVANRHRDEVVSGSGVAIKPMFMRGNDTIDRLAADPLVTEEVK